MLPPGVSRSEFIAGGGPNNKKAAYPWSGSAAYEVDLGQIGGLVGGTVTRGVMGMGAALCVAAMGQAARSRTTRAAPQGRGAGRCRGAKTIMIGTSCPEQTVLSRRSAGVQILRCRARFSERRA